MAVNFAPGPTENITNPLALALALGLKKDGGDDGDIAKAVQKAYLGQFLPNVGDTSPVQSPWQGAGRMANGLMSGIIANKMIQGDRASNAEYSKALQSLPGLGGGASPAMPAPAPSPMPSPMPSPTVGASPDTSSAMLAQAQAAPPPTGGASDAGKQALIQQLMNPTPAADMNMGLTGGNPGQGIDRSRIKSELDQNPGLVNRFANMVNGEVSFRDPRQAQIQAETAANRALTRNIPLAQALMAVNDPNARQGGKNLGYYASDTYSRPAGPQQMAMFQNDILPKILQGSDEGRSALGFTPTGNASGNFALNRAANGVYDASKWYSGQPGKGEMFAIDQGDKARMAQNLKSNFPAALLSPQSDAMNAQSFAPTQVAGDNMVPQPQQPPAIGSFTPGALPNVPNVPVRQTGGPGMLQAGPQQAVAQPQAPAPRPPQAQPPGAPQIQRSGINIPPDEAAKIRTYLASPNQKIRELGMQLYQQYKPITPEWKPLGDNAIMETHSGTTRQADVNKGTTDTRDYDRYVADTTKKGGQPISFMEYQTAIKQAGSSHITLDQRAATSFEQTYGEGQAKNANAVVEAGDKASSIYQRNQLLHSLNSAMTTGKITPGKSTFGAWASSVGIDPKSLGIDPSLPINAQTFSALSNESMMSKLGPGGFPSQNFSDTDRKFLEKTVTNLSDMPQANEFKLQISDRISQLQMEKADRWQEISTKVAPKDRQNAYEQFERDWRKDMKTRNVFGDISAQIQGGSANPPPAGGTSIDDLVKKYTK